MRRKAGVPGEGRGKDDQQRKEQGEKREEKKRD